MAEVVGLLASIIQVAGVGVNLSRTLYDYSISVSGAEKRLYGIAKDIELTSHIVIELGRLFEERSTQELLSEDSVKMARDAVAECDAVFQAMEDVVNKIRKNGLAKWSIYFRESKIDLLRSNLDRLKGNLQLLMQIIIHKKQVVDEKPDEDTIHAHRLRIRQLMIEKDEYTRKYLEEKRKYNELLAKVNSTSTLGGVSLHSVLTEAGPSGAESPGPGDVQEPDKRSSDVRGKEQEDSNLPQDNYLGITSSRLLESPSIPSAGTDFIIPHSLQAQELEEDIITGIPQALTRDRPSVKQISTPARGKDAETYCETTRNTKEKKPKDLRKRLPKPVGKFFKGTLIATVGIFAVAFFPVTIGYLIFRRPKRKGYFETMVDPDAAVASPYFSESSTTHQRFPHPYRSADIRAELPAMFELEGNPVDELVSMYTQRRG